MSWLTALPSWAVVTLFISISVNALFVFAAFVEPYRSVMKYALRAWTHGSGNKLNMLFFTKTGHIKRLYKKPTNGKIEYNNEEYIINNKAQVSDRGIPTQIYVEGIAEPHDPYNDAETKNLSTSELGRVMKSTNLPGILEILKQYWPLAMALVGITVLVAAGSLYMNWQIFDVVVQQGQQVVTEAASNATEISNEA